jgi:hypothetical protein
MNKVKLIFITIALIIPVLTYAQTAKIIYDNSEAIPVTTKTQEQLRTEREKTKEEQDIKDAERTGMICEKSNEPGTKKVCKYKTPTPPPPPKKKSEEEKKKAEDLMGCLSAFASALGGQKQQASENPPTKMSAICSLFASLIGSLKGGGGGKSEAK